MPKTTSHSRSKSSKSHSHAPAAKFSSTPDDPSTTAAAVKNELDFASFVGQSSKDALRTLVGGPLTASVDDGASTTSDPYAHHITKKDKRALKKEALLSRLNPDSASSSPYTLSASAARRAKRKSKTELTGGSLSALNLALAATPTAAPTAEDDDEEEDEEEWYGEEWEGTSRRAKKEANRKAKAAAAFDEGKIGEGKGKQMSAKARGKALQAEALRTPQILAHPSFKANPWATIRQHAGNSLIMKKPEPSSTSKGQKKAVVAAEKGAGNRGWGGRMGEDAEMEM